MNDGKTATGTGTLRDHLAEFEREGELYEKLPNSWVLCTACGHRCRIPPGRDGICKIRSNRGGTLYVPAGYVAGLAIDPIEKKPFFHALPGCRALSFGMLGCDYHCAYCQNWLTSQVLRDSAAVTRPQPISAEEIAGLALEHRVPVLTSTYNEPLITSEWAVEIFRMARRYGIRCSYVSNGNATPEVLRYLRPHIDFFKIDLKSFRQKNYQQLGGKLQSVLDSIRALNGMGVWVEVVTLVVPGFNDSGDELRDIAGFLVSVSPDIPWHVTAFHQDYKMTEPAPTAPQALIRAAEIGRTSGLRYVYAGNLPGRLGELENTFCPSCRTLLIERRGFRVLQNLLRNGNCNRCSAPIAGIWH